MKTNTLIKNFIAVSSLSLMLFSCDKNVQEQVEVQEQTQEVVAPGSNEGKIIPNEYIVMMKSEVVPSAISYINGPIEDRAVKSRLMKKHAATVTKQLKDFLIEEGINTTKVISYYTSVAAGFAIELTEDEFQQLSKSEKIDLLEHNREEKLPDFEVQEVTPNGGRYQTTPCGVRNAGGAAIASQSRWAWILDSGIDLDHPDLNVNLQYSTSFVGGSANDCNGHGTHVAGTVGAINNSFGVVGVASGASVVAVKIFGCNASSPTSTILNGLDYIGNNILSGEVINMSLGGYYGSNCAYSNPYRNMLNGLSNSRVYVAIAAGNESSNANYVSPGCTSAENVFTVASMTCNGNFSNFSNYGVGPCDYIATGSNVYSTYLNGSYATLSGTSMATPHVTGIMHVRNRKPETSGSVYYRNQFYPIAVR